MTRRKTGSASKDRSMLGLDDSPLGRAWNREIKDRRNRGHPSAEEIEAAVPRLPLVVKSGTLQWPAHWPPVPTLRLVRPALRDTASCDEIAHNFVLHVCEARLGRKPSEDERQRELLIQRLAQKIRGLRSEVHALGLSERDLFYRFAYHEPADGMQRIRETIEPVRSALFAMMDHRPGSAMTVLNALAPAAKHAFLRPRMWNLVNPPRAQSTSSFDAMLCVLSTFMPGATIHLAKDCAIAFHPDDERGICKRAAQYLAKHRPELRPREGISWGSGELSPLIPLDSSVTT